MTRLRLSPAGGPMEVVNVHQAKTHLSQLLLSAGTYQIHCNSQRLIQGISSSW